MMIERIGSVDPIQPGKKTARTEAAKAPASSDSVAFSSEAMEKSELYRAVELVSGADDVRADRIAELKQKINDPSYINEKLVADTADRIMAAFGL